MPRMTGRERVAAALRREPSDVVPFDVGGTKVTSLNMRAHDRLKALLEIDSPRRWAKYRSQRAHMSESMFRFLGSDVRRVQIPYPTPLPEEMIRPVQTDRWGVEWRQADSGLYYSCAIWQVPRPSPTWRPMHGHTLTILYESVRWRVRPTLCGKRPTALSVSISPMGSST